MASQQIVLARVNFSGFVTNDSTPLTDASFFLFSFAIKKSNLAFEVGESLFVEDFSESGSSNNFIGKNRIAVECFNVFQVFNRGIFFSIKVGVSLFYGAEFGFERID